jgi:hypothetical protein
MTPEEIFDEPYTEVETYNIVESGAEWGILNAEHAAFLNGFGQTRTDFAMASAINTTNSEPLYLRGPRALLNGVVLEPRTVKMTCAELDAMDWRGIALYYAFYFKGFPDQHYVRMCRYD